MRQMGQSWRVYADAIDDPKLMGLTDPQFRTWFKLRCLCSAHDGKVPPPALVGTWHFGRHLAFWNVQIVGTVSSVLQTSACGTNMRNQGARCPPDAWRDLGQFSVLTN